MVTARPAVRKPDSNEDIAQKYFIQLQEMEFLQNLEKQKEQQALHHFKNGFQMLKEDFAQVQLQLTQKRSQIAQLNKEIQVKQSLFSDKISVEDLV